MDGHESCYGTRGNGTCCKNHPGQVEVRPHGGLLDSNPASPADGLTKRPLSNNNRPLKGLVPTFISRIKQPPGGANDTAATQQVHPAKPIEQHEEEIASTVDTTSDHIDSHQVVHQRPTVDHDERIPPGDHHSPSQYEHESITHHHPQETDPSIGYGGTPTLPIYETELHHETLDWQTENPPEETSYEASDETDEQNQQVTEINHLISNMIAKLSTFPKKETLSPALIQQYGSPDSVPNTRHSQQHGQPLVIGSSISNQDPSLSSVSAWQQTDDRNKVHPVNPTESNPVRKGLVLAFFRRSPSFQQMLRDEHINNTSSETPERPSKQVSSLNNMPPLAEHHMNYVNGHNPDLVSIHHKVESIKTEPGGIKDPYWINRRPLHHLQSEEGYGHTQKHENTAVFSQSQRPVSVRVHPPHHKPQIHVLHQNNQMPSSNLGQHFFHYHHHHAGHVPQEPSSSTQSPLQLGMNEETLDEITSAERSHQSLHRPHFEAHGSLETNSLDQKNQHASFNTESPLNSAENFSGEAEDDDDDDSNESKEAEAEKEPQSFSGSSGEKWKECPLKFLCVPEEYCNIVGVIVKAPVFSTKLWQHFRVPLTVTTIIFINNEI